MDRQHYRASQLLENLDIVMLLLSTPKVVVDIPDNRGTLPYCYRKEE